MRQFSNIIGDSSRKNGASFRIFSTMAAEKNAEQLICCILRSTNEWKTGRRHWRENTCAGVLVGTNQIPYFLLKRFF
jgi:hypothetical protein